MLGQHQLQVMAQRRFNRRHKLVRHVDFIRQRAEHMLGLFERGQGPGAEAFMFGVQLLEHLQAGTTFRLLLQHSILLLRRDSQFALNFLQALLTLLDAPPLPLRIQLLGLHIGREFAQTLLQSRPLLFKLNLLRGELFQPHQIALFLQIERGDFIAHAAEILGCRKSPGLCLAQAFLLSAQIFFDFPQSFLPQG